MTPTEIERLELEKFETMQRLLGKKEALHPDLASCVVGEGNDCVLSHPLLVAHCSPFQHAWLNHQYKQILEVAAKAEQERDWAKWLFLHATPYQIDAITKIADRLTDDEYWSLLGEVFIENESIWQNRKLIRKLLTSTRTCRENLMTDDERSYLAGLPDQLTIYRGFTYSNKKGWSWTLDRDKAEWFAQRFAILGGKPKVTTGTCKRDDAFAYFDRREESEILIAPEKVEYGKIAILPKMEETDDED